MDSKTKLYVFAKKEVGLIFIFMILIAITSFVMGVKIGKNYSFEMAGITTDDQKKVNVELLSNKEEALNDIKKNAESHVVESSDIEHKLQEKISAEFGADTKAGHEGAHQAAAPAAHEEIMSTEKPSHETSSSKDGLSGKFTIQLGSHRNLKEAEDFAEGFKARGYDTIINQIEIKGKGTWYRVSLGAFLNMEDAKTYINKEKTLFIGQDYTIVKMP